MALINCPECNKQVSDKAVACPNCGFPIKEFVFAKETDDTMREEIIENDIDVTEDVLDELFEDSNGKRILMIQSLAAEMDFSSAKEVVDKYFSKKFPEKTLHYTKQKEIISKHSEEEKHVFNGVYRTKIFGGLQEVYCPRCGSEECSHYKEQKTIPGKAKTTYSANLNPFKPFTFVNKKEKVIRKEQSYMENKFICNKCGKIFY